MVENFINEFSIYTINFVDKYSFCTTSFVKEHSICTTNFVDKYSICTTQFEHEYRSCTTHFERDIYRDHTILQILTFSTSQTIYLALHQRVCVSQISAVAGHVTVGVTTYMTANSFFTSWNFSTKLNNKQIISPKLKQK
jgi:hypothetical protein